MLIGSEAGTADLSSGVFRDLVATGRSRLALFFVRAPAAIAVTLVFTGAAFLVTLLAAFLFAGGLPTPSLSLILQSAGWIALSNAIVVSLAVGIGSLTGSRGVTLTAVIGWQMVATQLLLNVDLARVGPRRAADGVAGAADAGAAAVDVPWPRGGGCRAGRVAGGPGRHRGVANEHPGRLTLAVVERLPVC